MAASAGEEDDEIDPAQAPLSAPDPERARAGRYGEAHSEGAQE
jgi:hypothetical protein